MHTRYKYLPEKKIENYNVPYNIFDRIKKK